jgi:hypothetical protein
MTALRPLQLIAWPYAVTAELIAPVDESALRRSRRTTRASTRTAGSRRPRAASPV